MFLYLISLIAAYFLYNEAPTSMNKDFMTICIALVAINISYFVLSRPKNGYSIKRIFVRHSYIFIICFFIVFFQADLDYILGFIDGNMKMLWIDNNVVCKAMALSTVAICSILLGYNLFRSRETSIKVFKPSSFIYSTSNKKVLQKSTAK